MENLLLRLLSFFRRHYPFFIILFLFLALFHRWVFQLGYLASGDWPFYYKDFLLSFYSFPQIWVSYWGFGGVDVASAFDLFKFLYGFLSHFFAYNISERVLYFWPIPLYSVISSYLFFSDLFKSKIAVLTGMIIFSFNTYSLLLSTGHLTLLAAYSLSPLIFYLFKKALKMRHVGYALITSLVVFLSLSYEPRATYITLWILFFYFIYFLFTHHWQQFLYRSFLAFVSVFTAVFLSAYWILPLTKAGVLTQNIFFSRGLFGNEFLNILYALALFHPFWTGKAPSVFVVQQIPVYFWLIPITAFGGLFVNRMKKEILFYGLIALFGILLVKQVGLPFSGLFEWLYFHFPGFDAYREASKFYFIIVLSYSVLIASLVEFLLSRRSQKYRFIRYGFIVVIVGVFLWNIKPFLGDEMKNLFDARFVPHDYLIVKNYVDIQPDYFRTLWVPTSSHWSEFSNIHPVVNLTDEVYGLWGIFITKQIATAKYSQGDLMSFLLGTKDISQVLDLSSIKYIFVPLVDTRNDDNFFPNYGKSKGFYITMLNRLPYLHRIAIGTKDIVTYENTGYRPHIYITDTWETYKKRVLYSKVASIAISPSEYRVELSHISRPVYLNFSELFHPGWQVWIGTFDWWKSMSRNAASLPISSHFQSDSGLNGFVIDPSYIIRHIDKSGYYINKDGSIDMTVTIYFKPEAYMYLGLVISGCILGGILIGLSLWLKSKFVD